MAFGAVPIQATETNPNQSDGVTVYGGSDLLPGYVNPGTDVSVSAGTKTVGGNNFEFYQWIPQN